MGDFPSLVRYNLPTVVSFGVDSAFHTGTPNSGLIQLASGVFASNVAYYYPFVVYQPATAVKMSYVVGATATGNVDLGIYDMQNNRLVNSGSTAQGTINTLQEIDITDTLLLPGWYMMAITASSGSGTRFGATPADESALTVGSAMYEEAVGSFGLPATATPIVSTGGSPPLVAMAVHFNTLV